MRAVAGIVSYQPDIQRLKENLAALAGQMYLEGIIIADNASDNIDAVREAAASCPVRTRVIANENNRGVAAALNQIMTEAKKLGAHWVLTCDQDSVVPDGLLEDYERYTVMEDAAVIAPAVYNRGLGCIHGNNLPEGDSNEVSECITSGSLNRITAWEKAGGFDEFMFIDLVDMDFCRRVRGQGCRILLDKDVVLSHELGQSRRHRFLFKEVLVFHHNSFRKYYLARNRMYMDYKYFGKLRMRTVLREIKMMLFVILYEEDKSARLAACLRGCKDGLKCRRMFKG